jgi:hypothetical protein
VCYNGSDESEGTVAGYKVLIDDNFHFMDESERIQHGVFATADEAIAACKLIVDECLKPMLQPGMTATALYVQYKGFGDARNGATCWARRRRSYFRQNGRM